MWDRLYTVFMWLVKLLFLFTIGYAATDIAPDSNKLSNTGHFSVVPDTKSITYLPNVAAGLTVIRLSSLTDSITT